MPDTPIEPNYQDILDKYAASLKSTEAEPIPDSEVPIVTAPSIPPTPPTPPAPETIVPPLVQAEEPQNPPLVSSPKENKFFKYLFFFSLIILLIVLASVIISLINSQKALKNSNSAPTAALSPTVNPSVYCLLNDQMYPVNQTFTATDGCNTCTCNADLTISCTEINCSATPSVKLTPTTSATTSASTTSLKTYTNSDPQFSLKYPETWSYKQSNPDKDSTTLIFSGPQGEIHFTWVEDGGLGGLCEKGYTQVKIFDKTEPVCIVGKGTIKESWSQINSLTKVIGNKAFSTVLTFDGTKAQNKEVILSILSSVKFSVGSTLTPTVSIKL